MGLLVCWQGCLCAGRAGRAGRAGGVGLASEAAICVSHCWAQPCPHPCPSLLSCPLSASGVNTLQQLRAEALETAQGTQGAEPPPPPGRCYEDWDSVKIKEHWNFTCPSTATRASPRSTCSPHHGCPLEHWGTYRAAVCWSARSSLGFGNAAQSTQHPLPALLTFPKVSATRKPFLLTCRRLSPQPGAVGSLLGPHLLTSNPPPPPPAPP